MSIRIDRLKALRKRKGLSQEDIAPKVGVKYGTYRNWEQGVRDPGTEALIRLAEFFGVSVDYLLGQSEVEGRRDSAVMESETQDGHQAGDEEDILNRLKNDPATRMVAKISGDLTDEGKKDLLKYAELLRNQRDSGRED